jgi:ABC-2 type transport system ATP-binding protein
MIDENHLAIDCRGLVKVYDGRVRAVDGLDLQVRRGECFGLLGPNGAGKTTTVEILEGLAEPTDGEVRVLGKRWSEDERGLRERIGLSLQETLFIDRLTVEETLRLFRSFYARGPTVDELLAKVSLEEKRRALTMKLSGGQKQRLAVGCALAGDPELLFLDEPTTGLDPQSRRQLWDVIAELVRRGRTVVLTTHYMDEAERLCDRVAVVDRGKVIALGTPEELIASLGGSQVVELVADGALDEAKLASIDGVRGVRPLSEAPPGQGATLHVDGLEVALPALLDALRGWGRRPTMLRTHRATLEDVFVHLTGRQLRD